MINRDVFFANSRMVTLTLISPPGTTEMAIQNSVTSTIPALETQAVDEQSWQWIPYQVTHTLMLDDYIAQFPLSICRCGIP